MGVLTIITSGVRVEVAKNQPQLLLWVDDANICIIGERDDVDMWQGIIDAATELRDRVKK